VGAERLLDGLVPRLLRLLDGGEGDVTSSGGDVTGGGLTLGARELTNVLWAVARSKYSLQPGELGRLQAALLPRLAAASAQDLSVAAVAAVQLAPDDEAFWGALAAPAAAALRAATAEAAAAKKAAAGAGASKDERRGKGARRKGGAGGKAGQVSPLYTGPDALEAAAAARDGSASARVAQAAANIAWAHARTRRTPRDLAAALSEWLLAGGAAHLNPRELSMLAYTASRWGRPRYSSGSSGSGRGFVVGGSSGGGGGGGAALPEAAISALLDTAAGKLWQFSADELNGLMRAAGLLHVQHPALLAALVKQLDHPEAAAAAKPAALSAALSAGARAGGDGGRALMRAAAAAVAAGPRAFTAGEAASVLWAAAAMGVEDDAFYAAALARVQESLADCGPPDIARALLGACGARDAPARARLAAAAAPAAAARAGSFSARDAAAVLRVLAAAARRGELEGHIQPEQLGAAAAALGAALIDLWKAGGAQRSEVADAAASLEVLCGAAHTASVALRAAAGGAGGAGNAGGAGGTAAQPQQ
jgi:hypothetical protein